MTAPDRATQPGEMSTAYGFQTVGQGEKQARVDAVFHSVARRYDLMNDIMSLGIHRIWKDALVAKAAPSRRPGWHSLDVAGGTGDIAFRLVEASDGKCKVTVSDINASMLAVGAALQSSGAVAMIVDFISPTLGTLPPAAVIFCVFLLTTIFTEIVSNNAVAVVVTPIAIGLAQAVGMDPRALVVAVMIAASCSFATPIGYQTNLLVYGPGGYRFSDYLKLGMPLNLLILVMGSLFIPMIWSF